MKYNLENITKEDIEKVIKHNATFEELESVFDFIEKIENEAYISNVPTWNKMCIALYGYKLGEMQGKRQERARRKKELINTTNPLKKKAINRALNISEDRIEEVIYILELLNLQELTNEDIKRIKGYICGYLIGKEK